MNDDRALAMKSAAAVKRSWDTCSIGGGCFGGRLGGLCDFLDGVQSGQTIPDAQLGKNSR